MHALSNLIHKNKIIRFFLDMTEEEERTLEKHGVSYFKVFEGGTEKYFHLEKLYDCFHKLNDLSNVKYIQSLT